MPKMDRETLIRNAMSLLGSTRTAKKAAAARANGAKHTMTAETRAKLSLAQKARRERERRELAELNNSHPEA